MKTFTHALHHFLQANKTAKMLTKVPRTGTGLDRMVRIHFLHYLCTTGTTLTNIIEKNHFQVKTKLLFFQIEKFLLKNLRQKPILTAYGFFALDKSTLFKVIHFVSQRQTLIASILIQLFTAIFTYMVILVQFKEMENSTKSINKF